MRVDADNATMKIGDCFLRIDRFEKFYQFEHYNARYNACYYYAEIPKTLTYLQDTRC